ncbi:MAG: HAD family phosphatase [Parvibaculum sp.]
MIKAILFDIGNVLVRWEPRHLFQQLLPDEAAVDHFLSEVCTPAWHFAHDQGVSFEENAVPLKERFPDHVALIDAWSARYLDMVPGEVPGMATLFGELEQAAPTLHGLTNMPSSIYPKLRDAYPMLGRFQSIVVSGDEKVCKPDREIFDIALSRIGLSAAEVFFIDDTVVNVEAASGLGFHAHHFKQVDALRADLVAHGVLAS